MRRTADGVVEHLCDGPLEVGAEVDVTVDWERRFDHMQQHSSQHLISAIALAMHGIKTLSWELGTQTVTVELDIKAEDAAEAFDTLETAVNAAVRSAAAISWQEFSRAELAADARAELRASAKSLPPDVKTVRIVSIDGFDMNPCCGTHLSTTAEMQAVKFLRLEAVKGRTLLHFASGGRVLKHLAASSLRDRQLNKVLCCGPDEYAEKVEKIASDGTGASAHDLSCWGSSILTALWGSAEISIREGTEEDGRRARCADWAGESLAMLIGQVNM